jgi:hypothetical protein
MRLYIPFLLVVYIASGCSEYEKTDAKETVAVNMLAPAPILPSAMRNAHMEEVEVKDRKLIKTGRLTFETANPTKTRKEIMLLIAKINGYIAEDQEQKEDDKLSHFLLVRVPASRFDELMNSISKGVEYFDERKIDVEDISEEYFDINSRIKAKKELEKRYLQLIGQAKKVSEMLEIERELGQIRSDIESLEGKINYMSNQVAYSTLSIRFYKNIGGKPEFSRKLTVAFEEGLNIIQFSFLFVITLWPVFILLGFVAMAIWRFRRRKASQS